MNKILISTLVNLFLATASNAEIITDGSVGAAGAIAGPNYDISAALGQQSGANLFHSFSAFNIASGETATFSGPASIQNIISRVTGNGASTINGNINSTINAANLWLINPNGIVFGNNASLNVSGAFHASTADYVLLEDGSRYEVGQNSDINLLIANPQGFGFLGQASASLDINGANISVNSGQTLSFVGSGVNITDSTIQAADGRINIASVSGAGEVTFTTPADINASGVALTNTLTPTTININNSTVDGSGDGGASIYLKGGNIVLDTTSKILNENINTTGAVIHLDGTDILIDGGVIQTSSTANAGGAAIVVKGNSLIINNPANDVINNGLVSTATGSASGGDIRVDVTGDVVLNTGVIRSFANNTATAGNISVTSNRFDAVNNGKVFSSTFFNGGTSGSIQINAAESILLDGASTKVEIQTFGNADTANIDIQLNTGELTVSNGAQISTDSFAAGKGAGIVINANNLNMSSSAVINARTYDDTGQGINITLQENLTMNSDAAISTDVFNLGQGSDINITANNVSITDGAVISASTKRDGNAGSIFLNLSGDLTVDGEGKSQTGMFSVSGDADPVFDTALGGEGGSININARSVYFENATLSSSAINLGDAGDINIDAIDEIKLRDTEVVTSAVKSAGGEININVINLLSLTRSNITAEAFGVTVGNDGGNVNIDPINVVLNSGNIIARANAGNGGNITIVTDALTQSSDSIIDASSQTGLSGEIRIESANEQVDATQYDDIEFLNIQNMLTRSCDAIKAKNRSSFIIKTHAGLPASPDEVLTYSIDFLSASKESAAREDTRLSQLVYLGICNDSYAYYKPEIIGR